MYLLSYDHGGYILWGPDFASSMASAVNWMTSYPKFKIGLDNEAYCYDRYAIENPEIIEKVRDTLKQFPGRFSIGSSSYGQPLAVFISEESNVRQITYAIEADLQHFGVRPHVYAISEHAYHSQIPQLILQAGYKMALMRTHFQMYGYNPTYDSSFGTWYGEDGSGIPTIPTYKEQGAQFGATTMDNYIMTRWPREWDEPIELFEEKFKQYEPLLASRYDDVVQRCEELTQHVETVDRYHWVTLEDLLHIYPLEAAKNDAYRPSADEFHVRMPWGYCGNRIFSDCRAAETLVAHAERLNAMTALCTGESDQENVTNAWKHLLISQHHDIQICGLLDEAQEFLSACNQYGKQAYETACSRLAKRMSGAAGRSILVINDSGMEMDQMVEAETGFFRTAPTALTAVCGDEIIPCGYDVTERDASGNPCRFRVRFTAHMKPMSTKVYTITETNGSAPVSSFTYENHILTTPFYEVTFSEHGICRIKDRKTGTILIDNGEPGALFAGIVNDTPAVSCGTWRVTCRPMVAEACFYGQVGPIPCKCTLRFEENSLQIGCRAQFDHRGETIGYGREFAAFRDNTNGFVHEEKLRFCFSVPFDKPCDAVRDLPFLIAPTNEPYIQGNYWTAVGTDVQGIAVFNRGSMCLTKENAQTFSIPLAYNNRYVWGEKCLWGTYTHEFSLRPVVGALDLISLHREALAYTYPLVSYAIKSDRSGAESEVILPICMPENIVMCACYAKNNHIYLRVYEAAGKDGTVQVEGYTLTECDLLENEISAPVSSVTLTPHQVKTYRLTSIAVS